MKINRHNYEEFFLLYADNELAADQKQAVDQFVLQNPDLAEELNILMQLKIVPDENIQFDQKEILYKAEFEHTKGISETNYEDYLLSYIDDELNGEERLLVEKFLLTHPAAKQELEVLQKAKLQVDKTLVFPDKSVLYRTTEEPVRVIKITTWWRVAAAAAVIITAGLFWLNREGSGGIDMGKTVAKLDDKKVNDSSTPNNSSSDVVTKKSDDRNTYMKADDKAEDVSKGNESRKEETEPQQLAAITRGQNKESRKESTVITREENKTIAEKSTNEPMPIVAVEPEIKSNKLMVPEVNTPNDNTSTAITTAKDITDKPALSEEVKTNYASEALLREDYQVEVARAEEPESNRKGLFRGFARKANRVLNKVTNPDPKKSSVRVAGFEIALAK